MSAYVDRVIGQENQYGKGAEIHHSDAAIDYYRRTVVQPLFEKYFGGQNHIHSYANEILKVAERVGDTPLVIASLCCGAMDMEIKISKLLLRGGFNRFKIIGFDIVEKLLSEGRELADREKVGNHIEGIHLDINIEWPDLEVDFVIAHHSLHHFVELEKIFFNIGRYLNTEGAFCTMDVIGRNGHMLWPENEQIVQSLWRTFPNEILWDSIFKRWDQEYVDFDCSKEGFEGIRAQDIVRTVLNELDCEKFIGYGGITDTFVGRRYSNNISMQKESDFRFLNTVIALNEGLLQAGLIRPTRMLAVFRAKGVVRNSELICNFDPNNAIHPLSVCD